MVYIVAVYARLLIATAAFIFSISRRQRTAMNGFRYSKKALKASRRVRKFHIFSW